MLNHGKRYKEADLKAMGYEKKPNPEWNDDKSLSWWTNGILTYMMQKITDEDSMRVFGRKW